MVQEDTHDHRLTTEKLGATRRRGGPRRRLRPPAPRRRRFPHRASRPSRRTACSCSATCTSTTPPRWRSAGGSARWRCSAPASTRRSSASRSTRRRTVRPPTSRARSTGTSTAPPTTSRSWRPCSAPTPWRRRAGRRSSPAPTPPTTPSTDDEKERYLTIRVVHTFEAAQRLVEPGPVAGGAGDVAAAAGEGRTRWSGGTGRAGGRSCWAPTADPRRRAWTSTRAGRCSPTCWRVHRARARVPPRVGGRRPGHLGQPRRVAPGAAVRRDVGPRHAPHDHRRRRADPVTRASPRIPPLPARRVGGRGRAGDRRPAARRRRPAVAATARAVPRDSTCSAPSPTIPG